VLWAYGFIADSNDQKRELCVKYDDGRERWVEVDDDFLVLEEFQIELVVSSRVKNVRCSSTSKLTCWKCKKEYLVKWYSPKNRPLPKEWIPEANVSQYAIDCFMKTLKKTKSASSISKADASPMLSQSSLVS
jgi:hypothetical protein